MERPRCRRSDRRTVGGRRGGVRPGRSDGCREVGAAGAGLGRRGRCGDRPPLEGAGGRGPFGVGGGGVDRLRAPLDRETKAVSDRSEVCEQMPGFETALADGVVSAGHVDAVANAAKGLDDAGRERLGGLADALLSFARVEPVGVRATLPAAGQTPRRRRRRISTGQAESVGVGAPLDRQTNRHAPHPPERSTPSVTPSCGRRSTPNSPPIKQIDGNAGTPDRCPVGRCGRGGGVGATVR